MSDSVILEGDSPEAAERALGRAAIEGSIPEVVDALLDAAARSAWDERRLAELLVQFDCSVLLPGLLEGLKHEEDAARRGAARSLLASLAGPDTPTAEPALDRLAALVAEGTADHRILAATTLGESGNPAAMEPLVAALGAEPNVTAAAADALGTLGNARAVPPLVSLLSDGGSWERIAAAVALGRLRDRRAVPALIDALEDDGLVEPAVEALRDIADPAAIEPLRRVAAGRGTAARSAVRAAVAILAAEGKDRVPAWMRDRLAGGEADLYRELLEAKDPLPARLLGAAGTVEAAERLLDALDEPELWAAVAAGLAALPADVARAVLIPRLPAEPAERRMVVLSALPPVPAGAMEQVARHLADEHQGSRWAAADAIARSDRDAALACLKSALDDPARRVGAVHGLGSLDAAGCAELVPLLDRPDPAMREAVAHALVRCAQPGTGPAIAAALETESDPQVRESLVRALGEAGGADAVATLAPFVVGEDATLRFAAVAALGRTGSEHALPHLLHALESHDRALRCAALHALGSLGGADAGVAVAPFLDADDRDTRRVAADALSVVAASDLIDHVTRAMDDPDWGVRLAAVEALASMDDERALAPLGRAATRDPDATVRRAAQDALASPDGGPAGA